MICIACAMLACYRPCCTLIAKRRDRSRGSIHEIHYPNDFSDFDIIPDDILPTYQDAASDLPPSYDHLYGETTDTSGNDTIGLDNVVAQSNDDAISENVQNVEDTPISEPPRSCERQSIDTYSPNCQGTERPANPPAYTEINRNDPSDSEIIITDTQVSSDTESNETECIDEPNETVRNNECTNEQPSNPERPTETQGERCNYNMRELNPELSSTLPGTQYSSQPDIVDKTMDVPNLPNRQLSLSGISENDECQV